MKNKHVVRDLDQLRALKSPIRQYIVTNMEFQQECSVSELAERLNCSQESLQFHIKKLLDVGLIKVSGKRYVNKRTEALYQLIARSLTPDKKSKCQRYRSVLAEVYAACFRIAGREISRQLTHGTDPEFSVAQMKFCFSPKIAKEVVRRFDELKEFMKNNQDSGSGESHLVTFSMSKDSGGSKTAI